MPSIWIGGLVVYRRYAAVPHVQRHREAARRGRYRRYFSLDTVMKPLLTAGPPATGLDADRMVMQFDLCAPAKQTKLTGMSAIHGPCLPTPAQNVHLERLLLQGADRRVLSGFFAPLASGCGASDGCFGDFVGYLKRARRTRTASSSFCRTMATRWARRRLKPRRAAVPSSRRIPLASFVSEVTPSRFTADLLQVALFLRHRADVMWLTGHPPRDFGPLFGRPIIVPSDTPLTDDRRRDSS